MSQYLSAEDALEVVRSGDRVYVHAAAAAPQALIQALAHRHEELRNVEVCHLHTEGEAPYADPALSKSFHVNSFFIGKNVRHTLKAGNGSYTPIFLSELSTLIESGQLPIDVALIQISPPDQHGYCSLGPTVCAVLSAIQEAKHVIAQVNPKMPRTHGAGLLHISDLNALVEHEQDLPEVIVREPTDVECEIGKQVASLIENRSTLQMGIGSIPNAVLSQLHNHKDLGLHTEMFSDGVIDLIEKDVITCKYKYISTGRTTTTFLVGSKRLYDFVDDNPFIEMRPANFVNRADIIRKNPKTVAINSAIEIDVTGQICADSIGSRLYSGVGGQVDFIRGASLSEGGKPIIAIPSTTKNGRSKIVPFLQPGAGVVTSRAHVHYVVTEYGVAYLYGKTIKQRVQALTEIAHPDHRENIARAYHDQTLNS